MLSRPSDNGHTPFGDIYLKSKPRFDSLGMPSLRDGNEKRMAKHEGWRGAGSD